MSNSYDVIICGAGPAGASAAYETASQGLRTLVIERKQLPRYKTCGGGVPMSIGNNLKDLAPSAFVEADVTQLRHTWNFNDPCLGDVNPDPNELRMNLWMVQRSVFDNALTQRAALAGAMIRDGSAVRSVEAAGETRIIVHTSDGEALSSRFVIGADGANGIVGRAVGLRKKRLLAIALEAEVPHIWGDGHDTLRPEIGHLEYAVRQGYAWIFPKADHLSVGAGMFGRRTSEGRGDVGREELTRWIVGYLSALGVPRRAEDIEFHGHPLPIWSGREAIDALNGRILLAGDAAGLINPLFGDGISYAYRSGVTAGRAVANGTANTYTQQIHDDFGASHDAAFTIAKFFYQFPSICYKMGVKHPRGTRLAARLIAGDLTFDSVIDRLPWKGLMGTRNNAGQFDIPIKPTIDSRGSNLS